LAAQANLVSADGTVIVGQEGAGITVWTLTNGTYVAAYFSGETQINIQSPDNYCWTSSSGYFQSRFQIWNGTQYTTQGFQIPGSEFAATGNNSFILGGFANGVMTVYDMYGNSVQNLPTIPGYPISNPAAISVDSSTIAGQYADSNYNYYPIVLPARSAAPRPTNNLCLSNLKVTTGQNTGQNSPDQLISIRVSDDRGYTYRELAPQSLGRQGQTDLQLSWRRTGISRDRVIEISCTEAVSLTGIFVATTIAGT
jgi:hypothetical protein